MAYPRISKNSIGSAKGITAPLTQRHISCKFPDLEGIGKMPIRSIAYCIIVGESTGTNGLKRLMLYLKSIMAIAAGKIEASNLYKTFPDLLL